MLQNPLDGKKMSLFLVEEVKPVVINILHDKALCCYFRHAGECWKTFEGNVWGKF